MEFVFEFLVISGVGYLIKKFKDHEKCHNLLEKANRDQMRNTLLDIHGKAIKYNDIRPHKKEVFYDLFKSYTDLGGNGFVANLKEDIDKM